jgi:hypothetical protein
MLAQKGAEIIICLRLLYCIRVANTSVLQKLTAHEQDYAFYYKAIDLHTQMKIYSTIIRFTVCFHLCTHPAVRLLRPH